MRINQCVWSVWWWSHLVNDCLLPLRIRLIRLFLAKYAKKGRYYRYRLQIIISPKKNRKQKKCISRKQRKTKNHQLLPLPRTLLCHTSLSQKQKRILYWFQKDSSLTNWFTQTRARNSSLVELKLIEMWWYNSRWWWWRFFRWHEQHNVTKIRSCT